jgi:hypothetical protein
MKRILVVAALLITVFSFSSCYPSGVVVRSGAPRYYSPRPYYGYYGRPHYYGGYRRHYYGYGYHRW